MCRRGGAAEAGSQVSKSSFNIFAVRRAFAYGHSLLLAQVPPAAARFFGLASAVLDCHA